MESFALFHNANKFGKKAAQLLTVTDNLVTGERASSDVRQNQVMNMVEIALESAIKL
jgi:purine-nucleoside phosphorylase